MQRTSRSALQVQILTVLGSYFTKCVAPEPEKELHMRRLDIISIRWGKLSITTKFSVAFGLLFLLILLVAVTSIVALTIVRRQMEETILTSVKIEQLVLKMDSSLQKARRLQRDFFLRHPEIGLAKARELYAQPAVQEIDKVVAFSTQLKVLIAAEDVNDTLKENRIKNLNLYLSTAERFATTFLETAELVNTLAADKTGLQSQLTQNAEALQEILQITNNTNLTITYLQMRSFEKDFLLTRQRSSLQLAFNMARQLRQDIENNSVLNPTQKRQALHHLDTYETIGEEIARLNRDILNKFDDFDLQAQAVDPVSDELIVLGNAEVERARAQIDQTSQLATIIVITTALVGLLLAGIIATLLNNSITRNVVKLTQTASELQAGNFDVSSNINRTDEIGRLAKSFNDMAAHLNLLVNNLEEQIIEQQQVEEALRKSRAQLQAILDHAPALISIKDLDGNVILVNRNFKVLEGPSPEEFMGKNVFDLFPADIASALWQNDLAALEAKGPIKAEEIVAHKDGTRHTYLTAKFPLYGEAEQPFGICAISTDITERKQAETALRESEEKWRSLTENSPDHIMMLDTGYTIRFINHTVPDLTKEQVIGRSSFDFVPADSHQIALECFERVRQNGNSGRYETRYVTAEEETRYFDVRILPLIDKGGNITGFISTSTDITERKWEEKERERLIVELQEALSQVKQLSGLLPICANCKKIRDDGGYWQDVAVYVRDHSEAEFTHGICPDCAKALYPEFYKGDGQ